MDNENAGRFAVGADPIWPHNEKDREKEKMKKCARNVPGMCARDVTVGDCEELCRQCEELCRLCEELCRLCEELCRGFAGHFQAVSRGNNALHT